MIGDPYEEADDQQRADEAKLLTPAPAKKSRKVFVAAMMIVGMLLALVMLSNIAGLVTGKTSETHAAPKPITMTRQQSDNFAQQQSGQAAFLKSMDRDKNARTNEDTIMGYGKGLASDAFDEVDGLPKKTKAQDDAEHGIVSGGPGAGAVSPAQQARERAELEAQHRRQNDLDSSPLALDFTDYFAKEKAPAQSAAPLAAAITPTDETAADPAFPPARPHPSSATRRSPTRLTPRLKSRKNLRRQSNRTIRATITSSTHRLANSTG